MTPTSPTSLRDLQRLGHRFQRRVDASKNSVADILRYSAAFAIIATIYDVNRCLIGAKRTLNQLAFHLLPNNYNNIYIYNNLRPS